MSYRLKVQAELKRLRTYNRIEGQNIYVHDVRYLTGRGLRIACVGKILI